MEGSGEEQGTWLLRGHPREGRAVCQASEHAHGQPMAAGACSQKLL